MSRSCPGISLLRSAADLRVVGGPAVSGGVYPAKKRGRCHCCLLLRSVVAVARFAPIEFFWGSGGMLLQWAA